MEKTATGNTIASEITDPFDSEATDQYEKFKVLANRIRDNRPGNSRSMVLLALRTAEDLLVGYRRRFKFFKSGRGRNEITSQNP